MTMTPIMIQPVDMAKAPDEATEMSVTYSVFERSGYRVA
jgi:hypothetical protein